MSKDSIIRRWVIESKVSTHPGDTFIRPVNDPVARIARVSKHGFETCDANGDGICIDADVVLAAIFRQAGIVDDLKAVLQGGGSTYAARGRIIAAFGEALS